MDAKKCDRCGVFYDIAKFSDQRHVVDFKGKRIDLCPKCLKELGDWFNFTLEDKEETLKEMVEKLLPEIPVFKRGRVYNSLIRFFDIRSDSDEGMVNELYYKAKSVDTNVPGAFTTYRNIGMETSSLMCVFLDRFYKAKSFKEETNQ